ncbi:MAG: 4-(cytidine 5'-diphospho)-2-C-methyl-D-erythritol kinase [Alphaproteobacteria bacterium]
MLESQVYLAPAKVNLFLHVGAPADDGFHPICSGMVFCDYGDLVALSSSPGLSVSGPFSGHLDSGGVNLVDRAMSALADRLPPGVGLTLEKRLPVAAGLGGGSSDAGAALRLLRANFVPELSDEELEDIAASLGSDGAACLWGRSVLAQGRGERMSPWPAMPTLYGVLVNPRVEISTAKVYRRFDEMAVFSDCTPPEMPSGFQGASVIAGWLRNLRNDLQAPALSLAPVIETVLNALQSADGVLLARMSGSGATCFAICEDEAASDRLAGAMGRAYPAWWVQACRLA